MVVPKSMFNSSNDYSSNIPNPKPGEQIIPYKDRNGHLQFCCGTRVQPDAVEESPLNRNFKYSDDLTIETGAGSGTSNTGPMFSTPDVYKVGNRYVVFGAENADIRGNENASSGLNIFAPDARDCELHGTNSPGQTDFVSLGTQSEGNETFGINTRAGDRYINHGSSSNSIFWTNLA